LFDGRAEVWHNALQAEVLEGETKVVAAAVARLTVGSSALDLILKVFQVDDVVGEGVGFGTGILVVLFLSACEHVCRVLSISAKLFGSWVEAVVEDASSS